MCPEHYIRLHLIRYKALPVSGFVILKLLLIMSGDTADNPGEEEQVEEAGPSLSQLWGYFEKADTQAKLILPDLLTNLYYLPLPKSSKVKKDAQFEREMRRFDFICQQESQNYLPINRSAIMAQIPNFGLTGRDRAIERKLVDPYRRDPQRRKELLQRVAEQQRLEFVHKPKPKPPTVAKPPAVKDLSEKRQVRQTMVIQRRTTLLESVQESLQEKGQRLAEKQQKVQDTLQEHSLHVAQLRATRLLLIISTINSLNTMYNVVNEARKLKAQSPTRWKACMRIQKWYRKLRFYGHKHFQSTRGYSKVNHIVQMLKSVATNSTNRCAYSTRKHACTVITSFLRDLQGRLSVYVKKFVSKIKRLQWLLRRHAETNAHRMALLDRLFNACLPAILLHMELVMQGRGHDLQNLTSYDLNKINAEHRRSGNSRLVGLMSSANFHAYLRNHVTQIPLVMVLFKTNTRLPKEVLNTKKDELFELLQRKRRQHICNLESVKIVRLHIPTFDTEHIKTFIHGGQDPLSDFLMDAQNEENAQHAALMDTRRLQQAKGRNSRFKKGLNNERICLLLQSIDVEDITILALSVAAKSVDAKTLLVRTSVAMKSFSVSMSVSSKMAGEVSAGDVESVATNDGNNKLALALASANKAYQEAVGPQGSAHPSWEAGRQSPKSCKSPRSPKGSLPRKKIDSFGTSVSARETGGSKEVYFKDADTMMRPATPPKKPAGSAHMVSPQKARRQSASLFKPL